jgi:hypothetical protein
MFVFDSVLVSVAGDGFTIVVFVSFFSPPPAGGVTVVSFCSHAASSAALARMQMYFFIVLRLQGYGVGEVAGDSAVAGAAVASGAAVAGGAAVSVFCSQAASKAALARMQMYFFISVVERPILEPFLIRGKRPFWFYRIKMAARISFHARQLQLDR